MECIVAGQEPSPLYLPRLREGPPVLYDEAADKKTTCDIQPRSEGSDNMSNIKNLEGKKFGRLTVLEQAGRDKSYNVIWRCRCDCGNEAIVNGHYLRQGKTKSCGCLYLKNHHNPPYARTTKTDKKRINDEKKLCATITAANMANINLLASAVLLQAIDDWRNLCNGQMETKGCNFAELRQFFKQNAELYFEILGLSVTPEWILNLLEKEREKIKGDDGK
jgi:hypothetical protein